MERLILWRLNDTTLKDNPLHENQHAFRAGKSTETALTALVKRIEKAFAKRRIAIGVFLDIQGAFNNVKPDAVIKGMRAKGIDHDIIRWYGHYLKNRSITVNHNGVSDY